MSAVAGRRTYTEEELQAALRDIQSGKLGTRRAAVIYGIPRSTLRNKVYKLALERERESHLNSATNLKLDEEEAMDEDKELSGAEEEKEVERALERPLLSMADILRVSSIENSEALKMLLQKSKDPVVLQQEAMAAAAAAEHGAYLQNLIMSGLPAQKLLEGDVSLPEVVKRMIAEEHMLNEQAKINGVEAATTTTRPSPSNSVIMKTERSTKSESDMETEDSTSNVILKIPSFKPTSSKNGDAFRVEPGPAGGLSNVATNLVVNSPPVTSESCSPPILPGKGMTLKDVKDVIAKSISQKFQQSPEPLRHHPAIMDMEFKRGGYTPPLGSISVIKTQQDLVQRPPYQQQPQQQPQKPQQNQSAVNASSSSSGGGKGTRPKRGKYRNYDRDSLVEAVRAVQRGEMSVHRAGSYYGVPHSTLEYKVKERHLMRPRKRDPKPNPVDEKIASLKQNDIRNAAEKLKTQAIKPPQKFPPTSPNGMKLPMYENMPPMGYNTAPFPFWPPPGFHHMPLDYARSSTSTAFPANPEQFFASQMMQKLHEESRANAPGGPQLAKSARQMAESLLVDGGGSNGFLDGIIRSSLESGVPSSDDKKEDLAKNVAPENMSNKALLDQLCRNSRLAPLTKPEPCSSGDDESKKGSPLNFAKEDNSRDSSEPNIHTIELSNDSNDSRLDHDNNETKPPPPPPPPTGRIYLKQELTKPENLKPEMLVRYSRSALEETRNGIAAEGSASESDAAQD